MAVLDKGASWVWHKIETVGNLKRVDVFVAIIMVVILLFIIIVVKLLIAYRRMIAYQSAAHTAWIALSSELKRRLDILPSLMAYAHHLNISKPEEMNHIFELRTAVLAAQGVCVQSCAERELRAALKFFLQDLKNNPTLRLNTTFIDLYEEYRIIDEELILAVRQYNAVVRSYNKAINTFPGGVIAKMCGHACRSYFDLHGAL